MNGKAIQSQGSGQAVAAIDTGTTLITGTTADVRAVWAAVPGSAPSSDQTGFFTFRTRFFYFAISMRRY